MTETTPGTEQTRSIPRAARLLDKFLRWAKKGRMTQRDFARELGVAENTVWSWKRATRRPSEMQRKIICAVISRVLRKAREGGILSQAESDRMQIAPEAWLSAKEKAALERLKAA